MRAVALRQSNPAASSWDLHRAWPEQEYVVVNDSNHAIEEPAMAAAGERMKGRM